MQVAKTRLNTVGWWGLILAIVPLPAVGALYWTMEDSNRAKMNINEVNKRVHALGAGDATNFPALYQMHISVPAVAVLLVIIGVVMIVLGRDTYIREQA
jgi:hypothetical protein